MINLLVAEYEKMKRYSILWIGVAGIVFAAALAAFQTVSGTERPPAFNTYASTVIWDNFSLVFPWLITLLGGFLIDREYTDSTLKNIITIPISLKKLLTGKLLATGIITIFLAFLSFICTLLVGGVFLHCTDLTLSDAAIALGQIVGIAFFNFLAVSPIITWFSRKRGSFFTGVGIAFFYGFCGIFAAGRGLEDFYPITAGLGIVRFTEPGGETYSSLRGIAALVIMVILTGGLLAATPDYDTVMAAAKGPRKIVIHEKKSIGSGD